MQRFECDSVILAVGETFDQDFCRASGLALKDEGTLAVDRFTLETSRPGFYAGGDVITGASNMSNAMSGGKQAARKIDERLMPQRSITEQGTTVPAGTASSPTSNTAARRPASPASAAATRHSLFPRKPGHAPRMKSSPASARRRRSKSAAAACAAI